MRLYGVSVQSNQVCNGSIGGVQSHLSMHRVELRGVIELRVHCLAVPDPLIRWVTLSGPPSST